MAGAHGPHFVVRAADPHGDDLALERLDDDGLSGHAGAGADVAAARPDRHGRGMLEVFDSMALRGNADARSMASGVSAAMICTMTGLAVSITGLYPVHYFRTRATRETELLADKLSL